MIGLRDLRLAHKDLGILMDSWMIVGPNDTGLSSTATGPRRLGGIVLIVAYGPQEEVVAGDYLPVLRLSSLSRLRVVPTVIDRLDAVY